MIQRFGDQGKLFSAQLVGGDAKNPIILGKGDISGGTYETVKFLGKGRVAGNVTAKKLTFQGSGTIAGDSAVDVIEGTGSGVFEGTVEADAFSFSGKASVGGDLRARTVQWVGTYEVDRDVVGEEFRVKGGFDVGGRLQAERITIELADDAKADSIAGTSVAVRVATDEKDTKISLGQGGVLKAVSITSGGRTREVRLEVGSVEADTVSLEATTAAKVSGRNVTIGSGCEIGTVEYTGSLEVADDARVGETVKK